MKISMNQLKSIIREESSRMREQHQPRSGGGKTAAEYISGGHEGVFMEVMGALAACDKIWDWVEGQVSNYARINQGPVSTSSGTDYHDILVVGAVCSDYFDGSSGAKTFEELEADNKIDGSWRKAAASDGFSLMWANGIKQKNC